MRRRVNDVQFRRIGGSQHHFAGGLLYSASSGLKLSLYSGSEAGVVTAGCVIVNVWPPRLIGAVRVAPVVFAPRE